MNRLRLMIFVAAVVGPFPACSPDLERPVGEFRIDSLGSIPITRNLATEPVPAPETLRPRESLRIGSASGAEETLFSGPLMNVSNGPNDQIFVLDQAAGVVRVFGGDGLFVRQFGRPGRGPGELSSPSALAWSPEELLWIPEPFERRYSVFDSLGAFVTTHPRPPFRSVNRRVYPAVFGSDGVMLDHASYGGGAAVFSIDASGALLDSFPPMPYPPRPSVGPVVVGRDRDWMTAARTFLPGLVWTLAPNGTLWIARTDSLRLIHRTLEGDTIRIIEASHRLAAFTSSERAIVERVSGMYEQLEFTPNLIQSLHASDDGHLLVQIAGEMGEPGHVVDIFGEDGAYLGSFDLEIPIQPLSQSEFSGGYFTYVGVGELDVPIVLRTRLGR